MICKLTSSLAIFITIGIQIFRVSAYPQTHLLTNPEDERKIIGQFYNYVDIITNIKLDNMLKLTQKFVDQQLDLIPLGDRGNTAELLFQYSQNSQRLRNNGGSIQEKEQLLRELQQLIATIKSGLVKQEQEDIILQRIILMGMFELLARLDIEERKFKTKFSKAATSLRLRFSDYGLQRHRELFELLHEIDEKHDIVKDEQLFARFKAIRANEV